MNRRIGSQQRQMVPRGLSCTPVVSNVVLIGRRVPALRRLEERLSAMGLQVVRMADAPAGLRYVRQALPDAVVLHISHLEPPVLDLVPQLRAVGPVLAIVVLAEHACPLDETWALNAGADDYRAVSSSTAVTCAHIRSLLRSATRSLAGVAGLALDLQGQYVVRGNRLIPLTERELGLLYVFLTRADQVITKEQLLQRVWGGQVKDTNLVEVYVKQLRHKLEAEGEPRLIETIRNLGYVLRRSERQGV